MHIEGDSTIPVYSVHARRLQHRRAASSCSCEYLLRSKVWYGMSLRASQVRFFASDHIRAVTESRDSVESGKRFSRRPRACSPRSGDPLA